ncbi:MAG: HesB/IscA family protein, partial [Caulobacteraceae bacterium]
MTEFAVTERKKKGEVTLSENAARRLCAIARAEGKPLMLRVAVEAGGCSGFQYRFELVEAAEDGDVK